MTKIKTATFEFMSFIVWVRVHESEVVSEMMHWSSLVQNTAQLNFALYAQKNSGFQEVNFKLPLSLLQLLLWLLWDKEKVFPLPKIVGCMSPNILSLKLLFQFESL